jgi:ABC-type Fe3+/spermidine/putrescine transport system ATPase subunit
MRLQRKLGVTSVYVTHDQSEALAMSSSVAVMKDGRIEQTGTPEALYDFPGTQFVATFLGAANLVRGRVLSAGPHRAGAAGACFRFDVEADWGGRFAALGRALFNPGDGVTAAIRPEGIRLVPADPSRDGWLATVETVQFLGEAVEYRLSIGGQVLRARCDRSRQFAAGDAVAVELRDEACTILAD